MSLPFRDINVHASNAHYAFTSPSTPSAPTLVVERPTGDLRLNDGALLGTKRVSSIAGILGIIQLKLDKYIIVITKAQAMGRLKGHMVYKVMATEFLPLRERPLHDPDEDAYSAMLKALLKTGPMYFSYSVDLTNSFQRQAHSDASLPLWQRADERFFWNRFVQSDLIAFRMGSKHLSALRQPSRPQPRVDAFILPVMFGMLEIRNTSIKSTPTTFALITRRSRHRAGTRYFSRGIDEDGHVSNFNETEQIVLLNDDGGGLGGFSGGAGMSNGRASSAQEVQILAFVQTRGSVPVFWAEINTLRYTPTLTVRGVETALPAAQKHFREQVHIYGENYLVNLVNQKGREDRVKSAYEQVIRMLQNSSAEDAQADGFSSEKFHELEPAQRVTDFDRLHYVYFDFHNETKGLKWHRALALLDRLKQPLTQAGYFRAVDMPGDMEGKLDVRYSQTGVVRTNCMDCLDRTNVVQTMLARWTLTRQLVDAGVLQVGESQDDDGAFRDLFRNVWADNADVVSRAYSGTGALKTDFTRTGQRTRAGGLQDLNNSITRYVKNNFLDGPRQDGFDVFLGTHDPAHYAGGGGGSGGLLFVDRRPVLVQAVPYLLAASCLMVFLASMSRQGDSALWPMRLFILFWFSVALWSWHFIYSHGMLYVNWPKLNTPRWAADGFQDTMNLVQQDAVLGKFVGRHERGASHAKLSHLEEGKKRIQ